MKAKTAALLVAAAGYVLMFAIIPTVHAVGAGVCVAGNGASASDGTDPYVGVNVGTVAPGAFTNQAEYEAACCAETGQAPDCFEPIQ
jgi:hypothetical protein